MKDKSEIRDQIEDILLNDEEQDPSELAALIVDTVLNWAGVI